MKIFVAISLYELMNEDIERKAGPVSEQQIVPYKIFPCAITIRDDSAPPRCVRCGFRYLQSKSASSKNALIQGLEELFDTKHTERGYYDDPPQQEVACCYDRLPQEAADIILISRKVSPAGTAEEREVFYVWHMRHGWCLISKEDNRINFPDFMCRKI